MSPGSKHAVLVKGVNVVCALFLMMITLERDGDFSQIYDLVACTKISMVVEYVKVFIAGACFLEDW